MTLVRLRGQLKKLAEGSDQVEVEGATVADVLRTLERAYPAMSGWILDERGRVRRHINVFVNGEQAGQELPVARGDEVEILPAISGG